MLPGMDAALATLTLEALQTRLSEALTALHRIRTGPIAVTARDRSIRYAEDQRLEAYINQLQAAIVAKQGGATRGPIYVC